MRWLIAFIGRALRIVLTRFWRVFKWSFRLWLVGVLLLAAAILIFSRIDRAEPADVIVVLGAGLRGDGRPGPALIRRSEQAAALWKDGKAEHIICTGGYPMIRTPRSEADACAEILRGEGVPADVIIEEDRSRSTEENAMYTREVMEANGWKTAVIVSDGYHLLRATWIFNMAGIPNTTSPAAAPPLSNFLISFGREIAAFHWQVLKGILNLPFTYVPVL
jgi:uncharacterized SAM-binding protein YcdF (DUF218 family)